MFSTTNPLSELLHFDLPPMSSKDIPVGVSQVDLQDYAFDKVERPDNNQQNIQILDQLLIKLFNERNSHSQDCEPDDVDSDQEGKEVYKGSYSIVINRNDAENTLTPNPLYSDS